MNLPDPELSEFAMTGAELPFRVLVQRHLGMVQAAAARRLGEFAHLAPDVAQAVFTRLAQRAQALPPTIVLGSWLYCQSQRVALDMLRKEKRRRTRELTALMNQEMHAVSELDPLWSQLSPKLDEALGKLPSKDRDALLLRFFEQRDLRAVGAALGLSPDAAQKRVARALEKLRVRLRGSGLAITGVCLAALMQAEAAPVSSGANVITLAQKVLCAAASAGWLSNASARFGSFIASYGMSTAAGAAFAIVLVNTLPQFDPKALASSATGAVATKHSRPVQVVDASAPISRAKSIPEIVSELKTLLASPQTYLTGLREEALVEPVLPAQFLQFLKEMEMQLAGQMRQDALRLIVEVWGLKSHAYGPLVVALLASDQGKTIVNLDGSVDCNCITLRIEAFHQAYDNRIHPLFINWLNWEPAAAQGWLLANQDSALLRTVFHRQGGFGGDLILARQLLSSLIGNVAQRNPSELPGLLAQIKPADATVAMLKFEGNHRPPEADIRNNGAAAFMDELVQQGASSAKLIRSTMRQFANHHEADCRAWIERQPPGSTGRWEGALGLLEQTIKNDRWNSMKWQDRQPRAELALEQAGSIPIQEALQQIVQVIAVEDMRGEGSPDRDQSGVRSWFASKGPAADLAMAAAARRVGREEGILWAAAISDPAKRDSLLRGIFRLWLDRSTMEQDGRARECLQSEKIPEEIKVMLSHLANPL